MKGVMLTYLVLWEVRKRITSPRSKAMLSMTGSCMSSRLSCSFSAFQAPESGSTATEPPGTDLHLTATKHLGGTRSL